MWNKQSSLKVAEALADGRNFLGEALDAEVLLRYVLQVNRAGLYARPERVLSSDEQAAYLELLQRRVQGEPVAYLTGTREFMGLEFAVSPAVLIPRPETEILVEAVLSNLRPFSEPAHIVDVGTGSGAIAVSLAYYQPTAKLYAVDISPAALDVARENAAKHGVAARITFLESNLLTELPPAAHSQLDWVVANLPYISRGDLPGLQRDVRAFEPNLALDGGADGLDLYRGLIHQAGQFLKPNGGIIMEIGMEQGEQLSALLPDADWTAAEIIKDYAGLDRFILAKWRPKC